MTLTDFEKRLSKPDKIKLKLRINAADINRLFDIDINSAGRFVKKIRDQHKTYYTRNELIFKNTYISLKHFFMQLGYELTVKEIIEQIKK